MTDVSRDLPVDVQERDLPVDVQNRDLPVDVQNTPEVHASLEHTAQGTLTTSAHVKL